MLDKAPRALSGAGVSWGIPFEIGDVVVIHQEPVRIDFDPILARQLVFMHTSEARQVEPGPGGFVSPTRWPGQLGEHAASYVILYADGAEEWLALLVRGHYADKPEIIAAHSSPVMVTVAGSPMLAAADAVTILEQIEGAMAYLDSIGARAEDRAYKRMRLALESAHRSLHNRMHQQGQYHDHTPVNDHAAHRQ